MKTLPDCPIVATRPSSYPFPELCGTGVVYKLGEALLGADHPALRRQLDLVALATIADVVPLVDENRALAAAACARSPRTRGPGCRRSCGARTSIRLRSTPAQWASGSRRGSTRPDGSAARTSRSSSCSPRTPSEARRLAGELEELNRERQAVEDRIVREAVAIVESMPEPKRRRRGYVLWGEEWHEGVIGIVASRLVERFHRPVVLIAGSQDGWKGSGRSVAKFDLHAALAACAEHLERFGGHRAAAGLSIDPASSRRSPRRSRRTRTRTRPTRTFEPVDGRRRGRSARELTLDLAQELERLAPFGLGNPDVDAARPGDAARDAVDRRRRKALRFRVRQHGRDAGSAIAFGQGAQLDRLARPGASTSRAGCKENHWNGTVSPQLVVRRIFDTPDGYEELRARLAELWRAGERRGRQRRGASSRELGLDEDGAGRRQLLESESFRRCSSSDRGAARSAA